MQLLQESPFSRSAQYKRLPKLAEGSVHLTGSAWAAAGAEAQCGVLAWERTSDNRAASVPLETTRSQPAASPAASRSFSL